MTIDQFKQTLKKPEKLDDLLNYLMCIFFIGCGLWFIYDLTTNGFNHPELGNRKYLIVILPLSLITIGIYGFWRIPKDYQIGCINSTIPINEKEAVVSEYLSQLKVKSERIKGTRIECVYRNKYLNSLVINVYLDNDKVLYNVRSLDFTTSKGIIDFGLSKRGTKRLKNFLEERL